MDKARARSLGLNAALAVLIADQATKFYVLNALDLEHAEPVALSPMVDLVLVWNRGIS